MENTSEKQLLKSNILDILDLYKVQYKLVGNIAMVNCLYHNGDNTPSMAIYRDTNSFYCFACHTSGTIETLVMKLENCSYKKAVELLYGDSVLLHKLRESSYEKPIYNTKYLYNIVSKAMKKALRSSVGDSEKTKELIHALMSTSSMEFKATTLHKLLRKIKEVSK